MFQNAKHHLSDEQLQFLQRGPTYVSPGQMHLIPTDSMLDQIVLKQMTSLRHQLAKVFKKYSIDISRQMNFNQMIEKEFLESFSVPLPSSVKERTLYERQLIESIQNQIRQDQLILQRTQDDYNTYYLGSTQDFYNLAEYYIQNSKRYKLLCVIDEINSTKEQQLNEIIKSIDSNFEKLYKNKMITEEYFEKFRLGKKTNFELPYMYFLPEMNQNGDISLLQARLSSCRQSPIYALSMYLDEYIRPMLESSCQATVMNDGSDFIQKLAYFCKQANHLTANTYFVTFEVPDLYSQIAHSSLLLALNQFLRSQTLTGRFAQFTVDTIEELAKIVLQNNYFIYEKKLHKYLQGCPLNLSFAEVLGSIYMHRWQIRLIRDIRLGTEFYARYHNMGFFTWNGTKEKLQHVINKIKISLPTELKLKTTIGKSAYFLNAYIENQNGQLYTNVYHDPMKQLFLLPYAYDHPRLIHRQWFHYALQRAGQYCTHLEDFQQERQYIELTFLANGYSLDFVEYHLRKFFKRYTITNQTNVHLNQDQFIGLRQQLLRYVQQQKTVRDEEKQLIRNHRLISLYYLYDWGNRCRFNAQFDKLWSEIINQDPKVKANGFKIILNSKHCYSSYTLLVQQHFNNQT